MAQRRATVAGQVTPRQCRNCGHRVTDEFCAHCGQREGRGDIYFMDAVGDLFGDVFTWDSRLWRTLFPLLLRPGFLSAEFNAGRRVRYMPAFRLYLVISFLLFLILSLDARNAVIKLDRDAAPAADPPVAEQLAEEGIEETGDGEELVFPEAVILPRDVAGEASWELGADWARSGASLDATARAADAARAASATGEGESTSSLSINISGDDAPPWMQGFDERLESNARRIEDDPAGFVDDLVDYLPQMMFLMLPIFALLLKALYLFRAFHYLQHLVFALHYHSFVYLLYLIEKGLEQLQWQPGGWLLLPFAVYLPLALRRCYGSGWGGALLRSLFLYIAYPITLLVGFALVAVLAILLM